MPRLKRGMTERMRLSNPRRELRPSFALSTLMRGRREYRMRQRTRSLACSEKSTRVSHHRFAETIRHSLHNGLRLILRSPRCP
jgi:hypothetical protein